MRNLKLAFSIAAALTLGLTLVASAAGEKFRADGTIQRLSSDRLLVRTSAQDIEIIRDSKTKVTGELRRGAAVTVFYSKVGGQDVATEIVMSGGAKPR